MFAGRSLLSATGRGADPSHAEEDGAEAFVGGVGWAGMAPSAAVGVAGGVSMVWLLGLLSRTR